MPPVTKAGGTQFRKDVDFAETKDSDEFELEAVGIVMVPDKADLQNDFAREPTINSFSDQFETFVEAGQADGGIMHAVWPDGWMELTRNEVLDESEDIGGRTVDPGSWVQRWGITNDALAGLIEDNILEGYSIGAIQVDWNGPFEPDEVDDVDTSEIPDDELIWELTDGIIREVSAVDIPAVPDAQILEAKDVEKTLADYIGNREGFIEEMEERGHTTEAAERTWDVLNEAMETDGADQPGKTSAFARAGKAFLNALTGTDDGDTRSDTFEAPEVDPAETEKEGRTLSTQNRESLFATIDASLDVLEDAGVDHAMSRFTDSDSWAFDLSEHSARTWENPGDHPEDEDPEEEEEDAGDPPDDEDPDGEEENAKNATGSDTPDEPMSDNDTNENENEGGDKDLAEQNAEQISELTQTVEDLADAVTEEEEKTVELEIGGEIYEVTESEAKAWFEDGEEPESDPMDDAPEYARALNERVEEVNQRIERINQQSGVSDQLDAAGTGQNGRNGDGEEKDALGALGKALS